MPVLTAKEKSSKPTAYSIEKLLGIKTADNLKLAERVEAGFPFDALERLGKTTGLPLERLRVAVRITPRTLTRRKKEKKLSPEESDRLVSVSRLLAQTFELFEGNEEAGIRWFTSPNRALGGQSPIEVAATETGTREVENLIGRLEHGIFT
ncbi:MAG TPA: antitoxin Xre/MbcA/ParS toxin-binding domain-containing protein, partial [Pyrinomonadaceae bacterium]|nr:antitoxin Xre/MbcA/ParS toxin-binding domain-containing protein [Pyrinomonadaceae bacterium]